MPRHPIFQNWTSPTEVPREIIVGKSIRKIYPNGEPKLIPLESGSRALPCYTHRLATLHKKDCLTVATRQGKEYYITVYDWQLCIQTWNKTLDKSIWAQLYGHFVHVVNFGWTRRWDHVNGGGFAAATALCSDAILLIVFGGFHQWRPRLRGGGG